MGSLRGTCPWCGHFGILYSPDKVGYPICISRNRNGTDYSCVWRHAAVFTAAKYTELALRRRFEGWGIFRELPPGQWETIAKFAANR